MSDRQSLPSDAREFSTWSFDRIEPFYRELERALVDKSNLDSWLAGWTATYALIRESYARLHVDVASNTEDAEARDRFHRFVEDVYLASQPWEDKLKRKLLASGLEPEGFKRPLENLKVESEIYREDNLPLFAREEKLGTEYDKIVGAQTVEWEGEEVTISGLAKYQQEEDRGTREKAWTLAAERQLQDREAINALWSEFMSLRRNLSANAGFENYRDFRWKQLLRLDYTPSDCLEFQAAIEKVVVPAATEVYEKRRKRLGLDTLRPWDLEVDPLAMPALRPFEDVEELKEKTAGIFGRVDAELGERFQTMRDERLLDLDNRKGKAPGGFCTFFAASRRPFIFMNAVGLHRDVQTLLHESGHAFHAFEISSLPYHQQWKYGMEFAEVASMSMELLAARFLDEESGGFYPTRDAARARIEHLEKLILFWPYMAVVDAFQHWVYDNHEAATDPSDCDEQWAALWRRFLPSIDYSGFEDVLATGWHRKLHIHQVPFYYVEYGLAQLGAVQVWMNSLRDYERSVADYRRALAMGCAPLPSLFATAGASFSFGQQALEDAVQAIVATMGEQEAQCC